MADRGGGDSGYSGRRGTVRRWAETTTIKGVPKFMKSGSVFLRLMWLLVVLIGLTISLYLLVRLVSEYLSHSTVTSVEEYKGANIQEQWMPFPDITLCNLNSIATHPQDYISYKLYLDKMAQMLKEGGDKLRHRYETADTMTMMEFRHLVDTYGFFQNYRLERPLDSERINTVFVSCRAAGLDWNNCAEDHHITVSMFHASKGPCFTINMTAVSAGGSKWIKGITAILHLNEPDGYSLNYDRWHYDPSLHETHAAGMALMVHAPNSAPNNMDYVNLSPGTHSTIHLEPVIKRRLGAPYSECASTHQEQMQQNPLYSEYLDHNMDYSHTHCMEICFQMQLLESCGCIAANAYHTRRMYDTFPFCGNSTKYDDVSKLLQQINCTHHFMYYQLDTSKCGCRQQCTETEYYMKTSSTPWPHSAYEYIFLEEYIGFSETFQQREKYANFTMETPEQRLTVSQNFLQIHVLFERTRLIKFIDKPAIDLTTMIGSLGGILNLWIGISFVTIFELVEVLYLLVRQ